MTAAWRQLRRLAFPDGGLLYRDAAYLAVEMTIGRPDVAGRWVPRPLRLAGSTATLFTAHFAQNSFGSVYSEAGLLLPVEHGCRSAVHCPWMVVDDDVALILGRELLGYPKKLAAIEWSDDDVDVEARVTRKGQPLLTMSARLGMRRDDSPPIIGRPHRNVRGGPVFPHLVAFTPEEVSRERRDAAVSVAVTPSDRDPLAALELHDPRDGRLHRVDLRAGRLPLPVGLASPVAHLRGLARRSL